TICWRGCACTSPGRQAADREEAVDSDPRAGRSPPSAPPAPRGALRARRGLDRRPRLDLSVRAPAPSLSLRRLRRPRDAGDGGHLAPGNQEAGYQPARRVGRHPRERAALHRAPRPLPLRRLHGRTLMDERAKRLVLLGVMLSIFLAAMESTVVSTAMPRVVASLGGLDIYAWVSSGFLLTSTVTMPLWGRLSDLYGRRPVFLCGLAMFLVGSALSGLSQTMTQLIVFRMIQGLGAGSLMTVGMTIIGELFTLERRARMQGYISGVWGIASLLGPLIGGLLTGHASWR